MLEISSAPKKSADLHKTEAFDADLHAANLTNWQQEYNQTSRGHFHGSIVELAFDDLQVFREHTSQALQQKCIVWPDSLWLGIPRDDRQESRINGLSIRRNDIMCRPGNCEFHLTTPQDFDIYGLVVKHETLRELARVHGVDINDTDLQAHGRFCVPDKTLHNVRYLLSCLLDTESHGRATRTTHDVIMIGLLEVLKTNTPRPARTRSYEHRRRVVDSARTYIDAHHGEPATITDLCRATHVSQRTLQYSFESILGISPNQYLRISRLNGVRRALLQSDGGDHVTDIASQWGFWHMSQFAKDYCNLFGEKPSQTLSFSASGQRP